MAYCFSFFPVPLVHYPYYKNFCFKWLLLRIWEATRENFIENFNLEIFGFCILNKRENCIITKTNKGEWVNHTICIFMYNHETVLQTNIGPLAYIHSDYWVLSRLVLSTFISFRNHESAAIQQNPRYNEEQWTFQCEIATNSVSKNFVWSNFYIHINHINFKPISSSSVFNRNRDYSMTNRLIDSSLNRASLNYSDLSFILEIIEHWFMSKRLNMFKSTRSKNTMNFIKRRSFLASDILL